MADIAIRYARALFDTGMGESQECGIRYGLLLERLVESISGSSGARKFLLSPHEGKRKKKEFLSSVFGSPDDRGFLTFLKILIDKDRMNLIDEISEDYRHMVLASQGTVEAVFESAFPLDQAMIDKISEAFRKKIGAKKLNATVKVNGDLIGGIRVIIGSSIYDGTTRSELDRLYDTMTR
jgi:ATP synthase, F1 delta subunit